MACDRYGQILEETVRGAPASPERAAHVRACPACARRLASDERLLTGITSSLERVMDTPPSADFLARVRGRMAEERARAATDRPRWLFGAVASVPIALALVTVAFVRLRVPIAHDSGPASRPSRPPHATEPPRITGVARSEAPRSAGPAGRSLATGRRPERGSPAVVSRVFVEPGQPEALARLARGLDRAPAPGFVVGTLNATVPLPELRTADLPRLEMKPLVLKAPEWEGLRWEAGGTASDRNEGSDS
jgi:hypothetical protein